MTKSKVLSIIIALVAMVITVVAFFVTFIPAAETPSNLKHAYVFLLIGMCAIVSIIPLILYCYKGKWRW